MKTKIEKFSSIEAFGKSLGLSSVEIALIRHKKKLIEKLKKVREQKKLSQAMLASMVGSKQPAIARMESGQVSEVSLDFLYKVAMVLEVSFTFRPMAA